MFKQLTTYKITSKHLVIAQGIAIASTAILFLFLRLYKIDTSLLFFNDIGRDFLILLNWQESGKPPLLGPQTSALPYNQSAVYFYLLYPLFVLTGHSPFATIITCVLFYLTMFGLGLIYLNKHKFLQRSFILSFFLLTIHPQVIAQNRFVWNPSFTIPLVLISFYSFYLLQEKFNKKNLLIFALSLTLAVSLSYSIAPLLIAFLLLSFVLFWKQYRFFIIWLMTGISLFAWNLPTMAFELRHNFLLTNLLIHGEKLQQTAISLSQKITDTLYFAFYNHNLKQILALLLLLATLATINIYYKKKEKLYKEPLFQALALLFLTVVVTFFVPVSMQAHYIFAILTLGLIIISLFNWLSFALTTICLSLIYLSPNQLNSYFAPAYRSVSDTQSCAQLLCEQETEPMFVSVQASLHPYHNGMEFKYLFKDAGCKIKELDTELTLANKMAVVVDHSEYQHEKTSYNELTQFGKSQEIKRYICEESLEVVILEKLTP